MVSAWRSDTKDTLPSDTTNVFCSSVVRRGDLVLRRDAVVDGHADGAGAGDEVVEVGVGARPCGRADDEATAVEVDDDRDLAHGARREVDVHVGRPGADVLGDDPSVPAGTVGAPPGRTMRPLLYWQRYGGKSKATSESGSMAMARRGEGLVEFAAGK
jgi:hypothetical protein